MPSLDEVLAAFPERRFLINIKSDDPKEGELLAGRLARLKREQLDRLMAYGGDRPMQALRERLPLLKVIVLVPLNYASLLWGWPDRFLDRMAGVSTGVFVIGPLDGDFSSGIDDAAAFRALPEHFSGGIWTNRIDRIAPLAPKRGS